jgi:hypothetical protein
VSQLGVYPTGTYIASGSEVIDVVTGNLTYKIPLAALPPSRGGLRAKVDLIYNSRVYDISLAYDTPSLASPNTKLLTSHLTTDLRRGSWRLAFKYEITKIMRPQLDGTTVC